MSERERSATSVRPEETWREALNKRTAALE
jgi:hypothetical protein